MVVDQKHWSQDRNHEWRAVRRERPSVTLTQAEHAARVPLRDAESTIHQIMRRLAELRERDARARALVSDTSDMRPGDVLLDILDGLAAEPH
ncbi:hypothetical protein [Caballeronia concitans]|uniref:Uncharacterized protein n=1 Tax=Caballeronia concitans TaxID=1777133 RepID=A0A658R1T7_9BURK|nr:hypothetical protein [Caballeronia concitans]KIG08602.1 hypothetical protein BurMR1_0266 [Burkholderia sp. MR1]SAL40292.1 hypothetical protein AWB72_04216 [Caballeronia concitans]